MEQKQRERNAGRLLMALAAIGWGLAGVCVKSVKWGSFSLIAARSVISLGILLAFKRSLKLKWTKTNVWGGIMTALTGILYVASIKLTAAGTAIVLQYIAPILVYLYGVLFRKKAVRMKEILIVAAVFFGCALAFSDQLDLTHAAGNLLALLSGFTFAGQIVITNSGDGDAGDAMIISNLLAFGVCLPLAFFDPNLVWDVTNVFWVLILGIFQYGLANVCFSRGIQRVEALEGSLILTIEPVFNPIPVWIFCGETMGVRAILGSVIVIVFVTLYGIVAGKENRREEERPGQEAE